MEQIPYRRRYRRLFGDAFDTYLEIIRIVEKCVKGALGQDAPNWQVLNACPACAYEVRFNAPTYIVLLLLTATIA